MSAMSERMQDWLARGPFDVGRERMTLADWAPTATVSEDPECYLIRADLPGVKKDDVHVQVEAGVLTIRGERRHEAQERNEKMHRMESSYGSFMRSFSLPDNADEKSISAEHSDGQLTVRLGKTARTKTPAGREIPIKST